MCLRKAGPLQAGKQKGNEMELLFERSKEDPVHFWLCIANKDGGFVRLEAVHEDPLKDFVGPELRTEFRRAKPGGFVTLTVGR